MNNPVYNEWFTVNELPSYHNTTLSADEGAKELDMKNHEYRAVAFLLVPVGFAILPMVGIAGVLLLAGAFCKVAGIDGILSKSLGGGNDIFEMML